MQSPRSKEPMMGFDDLAALFLVMREQQEEEMSMLTFELAKKD